MKRGQPQETFNFWPSVSDLMLGAFMLALLLWICSQLQLAEMMAKMAEVTKQTKPTPLLTPKGPSVPDLQREIDFLNAKVKLAEERPQTFNLPDAQAFTFVSGKWEFKNPTEFAKTFRDTIVPKLQEQYDRYRSTVNTLEVIGHTDEKGINGLSVLDHDLSEYDAGHRALTLVRAGSNADLGLLRALAVAEELRRAQSEGRLARLPIRVYSAAARVPVPEVNGIPVPDEANRRIEIRLSQPESTPN